MNNREHVIKIDTIHIHIHIHNDQGNSQSVVDKIGELTEKVLADTQSLKDGITIEAPAAGKETA